MTLASDCYRDAIEALREIYWRIDHGQWAWRPNEPRSSLEHRRELNRRAATLKANAIGWASIP